MWPIAADASGRESDSVRPESDVRWGPIEHLGQPLDDVRATLIIKLPGFSGRHSVQVHIDEDAVA